MAAHVDSDQPEALPRHRCCGSADVAPARTLRSLSSMLGGGSLTRLNWKRDVLPHAAEIVESYDTKVTLRQLFHRLVADGTLPNLQTKYRNLSAETAKARRAGTFPELLDRRGRIERQPAFDGPADAIYYLIQYLYRRERTEGQKWSIDLGVERGGLSEEQLDAWFGDELGLPILALGGYASQSFVAEVRDDIARQDRPAVLIYAVCHMDPTGEDIDRDFEARVGGFDEVRRIALFEHQVLSLPHSISPEVTDKLERDPRADGFVRRHRDFLDDHIGGEIVQFEVDALSPDDFFGTCTSRPSISSGMSGPGSRARRLRRWISPSCAGSPAS